MLVVPDLWEDTCGVLKHTFISCKMDRWMDEWMGRWIDEATSGARGMAGSVRSAATYTGHVCVHVDLVANFPAASGTRLERVWNGVWNGYASVALGNASKQRVNMVVSTM